MPSLRRVWRIAWPIILANSTMPLLGLVDTAVIGNTGSSMVLGAIALGALIFNFFYWSFGFLRMGTTGFTAQADGAGDAAEVRAILGRALLIAVASGLGLILLQWPIATLALTLLGASTPVETLARDYLTIRIWAASASLALYALMGTMIGMGHSGKLLRTLLLLSASPSLSIRARVSEMWRSPPTTSCCNSCPSAPSVPMNGFTPSFSG